MGDGALGSDHVNYLILRYLQESGHENAAKALYQDWNRETEYGDPESLPFAPVVNQHELVNIIQDGLYYDQIQASVANTNRRFKLIEARASRPTSSHQPSSESRIQQSNRRMSTFAQTHEREDFPTPAAKRVRRSNASDAHVNGDAMEVDKSVQGDDDSPSAEPDRAQSETEPATAEDEVPIETSSSATQTDKKAKTITETVYWSLDKNEPASILHTMWNPQPAMTTGLLTVGESLCRLYEIPMSAQDGGDVSTISPCWYYSSWTRS